MQHNIQSNHTKQSLHQDDISNIIKHFSFTIQQRFQEIQKNCHYFTCLNSINYDKSELEKDILHRYLQYKTTNQHEIKLLQKFVQRLMQIFQFFRHKTQQPQILQSMGQKISERLKQILKNQSDFHFFVNNRPKTHSTNVKPLGNRSTSNDFLSIVGPACKQEIDLNAVFINNKKFRTQTQQKRSVEVGKLFKYVFSVLKRGFLIKMRMEKPQKKIKQSGVKDFSCIQQNSTISVQGTCAILRNCSEKSNKQNVAQIQAIRMANQGKERQGAILGMQNKKQFSIYQKIKNRSVSTNQYSILSIQNPLLLQQSGSNLKELDSKVGVIYDIMNIEKYNVVKVAKDPEAGKKDQVKRNSWIENQIKIYEAEHNKWAIKCSNWGLVPIIEKNQKVNQQIYLGINKRGELSLTQNSYDTQGPVRDYSSFPKPSEQCEDSQNLSSRKNIAEQRRFESNSQENTDKIQHQVKPISKTIKTQQVDQFLDQNIDQPAEPTVHTLIVCSSRNHNAKDIILADKSSNLMDLDRSEGRFKQFKSRSIKQDRKSLRLNLPNMLGDKSNLLNQPNVRMVNSIQQDKNQRVSEKSQHYMQNYLLDSGDDGSFVPLLPKRQKNSQNNHQNKNQQATLKKKNINANFHPLNRCRVFREKKITKNSSIIQGYEVKISGLNQSILKNKIRNSVM